MNTIKAYVKENGLYRLVEGNIADIVTAEMLDEQLDEARLVLTNSPIENYPPLTEFRIDFLANDAVVKRLYFVSGEPKATAFVKPMPIEE